MRLIEVGRGKSFLKKRTLHPNLREKAVIPRERVACEKSTED